MLHKEDNLGFKMTSHLWIVLFTIPMLNLSYKQNWEDISPHSILGGYSCLCICMSCICVCTYAYICVLTCAWYVSTCKFTCVYFHERGLYGDTRAQACACTVARGPRSPLQHCLPARFPTVLPPHSRPLKCPCTNKSDVRRLQLEQGEKKREIKKKNRQTGICAQEQRRHS